VEGRTSNFSAGATAASAGALKLKLRVAARSILLGWATLLPVSYLLERPLLNWIAPFLANAWIPTAQLALDCCIFTATGWVIGYFNRAHALFAVLVFAATLTLWDFTPILEINVPWLLRLIADSFRDSRFLASLATTAATHAFLFGCLIAGAMLARPTQKPVSIFRDDQSTSAS